MRAIVTKGLLLGCALAAAAALWAAVRAKVVIQAQHYATIQPSMACGPMAQAAGGKAIYIPLRRPHGEDEMGPADEGNAVFKLKTTKAGVYRLWVRARWYDSCGDSFFVVVDTQPQSFIGEDGTNQKWHWVKGKTYQLAAGVHSIKFQNREDGAAMDELLLTTDLRYVPTRVEKETAAAIVH
jgi:hypothetical protein